MTPEERAARAAQILTNPVFSEAFDALRAAYIDKMISTHVGDEQKREHFHKSILVLQDVRTALTAAVEKGKIEKSKLVKREIIKK